MDHKIKLSVITLLLCALPVGMAQAQGGSGFTLSGIGGRLGVVEPEDLDGSLTASFHLEFMKPGSRWHFSPEIRYWNDGPLSDLNLNLNAFYHFAEAGLTSPYLGVGGGLHFYDVDGARDGETDPSVNLLGGVLFPLNDNAHLFLEGRYAVTDLGQLDVVGGFTVPLTH